jgi:phosphotransferase system HPr (HPr) family protein
VRGQNGLHARPAAEFVRAAAGFDDHDVTAYNLTALRGPANAKSITAVLTLAVRQGDEVLLTATGPSPLAVLDVLAAILEAEKV